jgi:DNA-binding transcriptional LysR family regulator
MIPEFGGDFTQWLRGFWLSAHSGNMTAAGGLSNRTQSAISHQIKALEDAYGVVLFERSNGRKLELTSSGKVLLKKTVKIFELINSINESIGVLPAKLSGNVHIATTYTVVEYYLPYNLEHFKKHYPNVEFHIHGTASQDSILEMVLSGKVDMGILCTEEIPTEFQITPLFSTRVSLVTPKTGPYALTSIPRLELIGHIPYIAPPHDSSMERFVTKHLKRRNVTMQNTHMVSYHEAAKIYTRLGLGITFLDYFACTEKDKEELNVIPMSAYFPQREFMAVELRQNESSLALEAFIRFLHRKGTLPGKLPEGDTAEAAEGAAPGIR